MNDENEIVSILKYNMLNYGGYIITDRVLPSVEDGLKPSYRRILWAMEKQKATKFVKSGNISGNVFKYHPHGNVYPTMVNMTQTDRNNIPYLIGRGNFGQHTSRELQAGAERYTECKLSEMAQDMLDGVKKNMVEMINNYDDTEKIPKYLPVKFPSILCYASQGIAIGMASSIPSFNIIEVCEATKKYLETGEKSLIYPDFATGGDIIRNDAAMMDIINTGKGSVRVRGRCQIVDSTTINVTQIPYNTFRESIIDTTIKRFKDGRLKEINNVKDLTGINGLSIEISCKKNTDIDMLLEKLYKLTPLEEAFNCNMNVLVGGKPMVLGMYEIVDFWYNFRASCIKNALINDYKKLVKEMHLLTGLKQVLLDIDKAISIIRISKNPEREIVKIFNVDNVQAEYICGIQLRKINKAHIMKQINEISIKKERINEMKSKIENPESIKEIVLKDLDEVIKKHGIPRKSRVIEPKKSIALDSPLDDGGYNVKLQLSKDGYFKKIKANAYRGENKLKEGDEIIAELNATNSDEIVFFGSDLNAYKFRLYELEDNKLNSLGLFVKSKICTDVLGMTVVNSTSKFIIICYKDRISKVDINSFVTVTNRKKLSKSLFNNEVQNILTFDGDGTLIIETAKGNKKTFKTKDIVTKKARDTQGIKVLGKDSIIKSYIE